MGNKIDCVCITTNEKHARTNSNRHQIDSSRINDMSAKKRNCANSATVRPSDMMVEVLEEVKDDKGKQIQQDQKSVNIIENIKQVKETASSGAGEQLTISTQR